MIGHGSALQGEFFAPKAQRHMRSFSPATMIFVAIAMLLVVHGMHPTYRYLDLSGTWSNNVAQRHGRFRTAAG
jgi:hypothetical protein